MTVETSKLKIVGQVPFSKGAIITLMEEEGDWLVEKNENKDGIYVIRNGVSKVAQRIDVTTMRNGLQ